MEALLDTQTDLLHQIKRLQTNFDKTPKDRITRGYLEARLETLQDYWKQFQQQHRQLLLKFGKKERESQDYFATSQYDTCSDVYLDFTTKIKEKLLTLSTQPLQATTSGEQPQQQQQHELRTKLPPIQIPKFSGNYRDWTSFHDLYNSLINNNDTLSDVQKYHYLKSNLSGEAEQLLKHISITEANYKHAWEILKKRYSNKRCIASTYMGRLLGQRKIMVESARSIRELLDTTTECLETLKSMELNTDAWGPIVAHIIISKLDTESHKQFEMSHNNSEEVPNWEKLSSFLESRFRTLETLQPQPRKDITPKDTIKSYATTLSRSVKCIHCNDEHYMSHCKEFAKLGPQQRKEFVERNRLCYNCLIPKHAVKFCNQTARCKRCGRKHHTLLHDAVVSQIPTPQETHTQAQHSHDIKTEARVQNQKNKTDSAGITSLSTHLTNCYIMLATALIRVQSPDGRFHTLRALVDPGSQISIISESTCKMLHLTEIHVNAKVKGIDDKAMNSTIKSTTILDITSRMNKEWNLQTVAYVMQNLPSSFPFRKLTIEPWSKFKHLELADPSFHNPGKIDILLGANVYPKIMKPGLQVFDDETLMAQESQLGWLITGSFGNDTPTHNLVVTHCNLEIDGLMKRFWEIEEHTQGKRKMTQEEEKCEKHYKDTLVRDEEGRYIVKLPFKEEPSNVGMSRQIAIKRQTHLERKLQNKPELKEQYIHFMRDYIQKGHMKKVEESKITRNNSFYLPHHAVVNEEHLTTKLRVVFDGSAAQNNGVSLNSQLLTGPSLQNDLRDVVMHWRKHAVAVIADIRQMYRQIRVDEEDADYQRIVWRESSQNKLQDYRLTTVTYGTSCAPYLAIRTLNQLAEDERKNYPLVADVLLNEFYMDDCLSGSSDIEGTIKLVEQLIQILQKGGFSLHKWASNRQEVLDTIPRNLRQTTEVLEIPLHQSVKTLGIMWNPKSDNFELRINLPRENVNYTKRQVLSDIAKIFDPLGFLGPVVISPKIILQKIWMEKLDWDDEIPEHLQHEWSAIREEIIDMSSIYIPRWIGISTDDVKIELHGFSDASSVAYAAVVYVRVVTSQKVTVSIVEAKTKVAPVKQVSLPRLELCAAVMLAGLLHNAKCCYDIQTENVYAWTDSKIVLAWLARPTANWNVFVANRVTEIVNKVEPKKWFHVSSADNAADVASRGIKASCLAEHNLWWSGPHWLKELHDLPLDEPLQLDDDLPVAMLEYKNKIMVNTYQVDETTAFFSKYSTLTRLIRVTAYCIRFIKNCKAKRSKMEVLVETYLTTSELRQALHVCIKMSQSASFENEIVQLQNVKNKPVNTATVSLNKRNKILPLNPYVDENNMLRVGGRIEHANVPREFKHPIILAKDWFSSLIIADAHIKTLHGGYQLMLNYIRQNYWIFGLKQRVKKYVRVCVTCSKRRAKSMTQFMANLPPFRVTPSRPFSVSGVDFAGPILLKSSNLRGNKSQKAYIALFICMSTKAIHLELVSSLDTPDFIAAFKRFVARRGHCREMWSDCGTNFIGANKVLKVMHNQSKRDLPAELLELLAKDGTDWHFIPPGTPHFGGLWEAGVKYTKHHLKRVIGEQVLTFEEFYTLLTQIESCLNSRPLVPVSDDIDNVLTPGHFLIGEAPLTVPDEPSSDCNITYQRRWKLVQQMLQGFWKKWSQEYLVTLQTRYKWQRLEKETKIDDIVLIKDERCLPAKWLLGRIIEKHPGKDGITRVVTVRCKNTTIKRPIHKLCLLPVNVPE